MSKCFCGLCEREISESACSIQCTECKTWYHKGCSSVTNKNFNELYANVKKKKNHTWICDCCKQPELGSGRRSIGSEVAKTSRQPSKTQVGRARAPSTSQEAEAGPSVDQQISELLKKRTIDNKDILVVMLEIFKTLKEQRESSVSFINEIRCFKTEVNSRMLEMENKISEMESEIISLKTSDRESPTNQLSEPLDEAHVLGEIQDRARRTKNIMIFDVKESKSEEVAARVAHDKAEVTDILKSIDVEINDFKVIRLGKQGPKPRPIKAILGNTESVKKCLCNKKLLKDSPVRISADFTPFQRQQFNKARDEMKERKEKGEENIGVVFVNGVPKVRKFSKSLTKNVNTPHC